MAGMAGYDGVWQGMAGCSEGMSLNERVMGLFGGLWADLRPVGMVRGGYEWCMSEV